MLQGGRGVGTRARRALKDLRWRQKFNGAARYELQLASGRVMHLEQQARGELEGLGTGGTVWPAAHVLARYLERRAWPGGIGDMRGLRVLELGAGTACASVVCAALGASRVVATDLAEVIWLCAKNASANSVLVETRCLDWTEPSELEHFDLVLASECVLPQLYPLEPLATTLAAALRADTIGLVAYEHRTYPAYDPRARFTQLLAERGVTLRIVPQRDLDPDFSADDIEIWELSRGWESRIPPTDRVVCVTWGQPSGEYAVSRFEMSGAHHTFAFDIIEHRRGGIGSGLWPAALAAARYFVTSSRDKPPKTVLDLGAGCGLLTVALARLGHTVIASDLPEICSQALIPNLEQALPHDLVRKVHVRHHSWGRLDTIPVDVTDSIDLVVCSDCAYNSTELKPLLTTLASIYAMLESRPPDLVLFNEQRTALDALLSGIRHHPDLCRLHLTNLHLPASYWMLECAPPHRQPPPVAAFRSAAVVAL